MINKFKMFSSSIPLLFVSVLFSVNIFGNTLEQSPKVFNLSTVANDVYALQAKLLEKKIDAVDCASWGKQCGEAIVCCGSLVCTDGVCLEYVHPR